MGQQQKTYTIQNQSQFPYLTKIKHLRQAKQQGQKQKSWNTFLVHSGSLMTKWFNFTGSDFILIQIDQKDKKVKFVESHKWIHNFTTIQQHKIKGTLLFNQIRSFDQKIQLNLSKNLINGAISPSFSYNWTKYDQKQWQKTDIEKVLKCGVKCGIHKWLSNNLTTNQKQIFLNYQTYFKHKFLPFQKISTNLFVTNRANYHQQNQKNQMIGENVVKQSSDIFGYSLTTFNQNLGLQMKLQGGYDHFHRYNFNKVMFKFGNFREFQRHVVELSVRAGAVYGKNLMENDLLNRSKSRWVDDRSLKFLNTRVNLLLKNFHPVFGGVFQIVPFFYLQGCASQNPRQIKTKYQLDYGIGVRFLNVGLTLDASLIRLGKNLDDINPSIKINF